MNPDEVQFIQAFVPWVSGDKIITTHRAIACLSDAFLTKRYVDLTLTIPAPPKPSRLRSLFGRGSKFPQLRILREDTAYIQWLKVNGLEFELLEWEMNKRGVYPRILRPS